MTTAHTPTRKSKYVVMPCTAERRARRSAARANVEALIAFVEQTAAKQITPGAGLANAHAKDRNEIIEAARAALAAAKGEA